MAVPSPNKTVAFQFDQSTSAIAIGKIRMAAAANEAIPEGWAIDRDGNPTTNAEAALGGSLLSSGGYKGYGFGLMAEVLASALTGSVSSINAPPLKTTNDEPHSLGQSYILIDPDFNGKKDQFSEHISKLSTAVEHQPKARLPGSKKKLSSNIEIDATLWDQVLKLSSSQPI
jgi:(2R)-3-sulfolactate dehydrogenase (NADP+)